MKKTLLCLGIMPLLCAFFAVVFSLISCGGGSKTPGGKGEAPDDLSAGSNLVSFVKNGKCGFIDTEGDVVIEPYFESTHILFDEGLAAASKGGKWGFINPEGEWVVEPQYTFVSHFSEGLALVVVDNKGGFIDRTGKMVIEPRYDKSDDFSDGLAGVLLDGQYGYIDKSGNMVLRTKQNLGPFKEGRAGGYVDNSFCHIDKQGNPAGENRFDQLWSDYSEGLALVQWAGETWFVDTNDMLHFGHGYESAMPFREGIAPVLNKAADGKAPYWTVINKSGETVCRVEGSPDVVYSYSSGLALVRVGGKFGYVNRDGKVVIEPSFDNAYSFFENGVARVTINGSDAYIDKRGKVIWKSESAATK